LTPKKQKNKAINTVVLVKLCGTMARISEIKLMLKQMGIPEESIPQCLRGVCSYNLGLPLGDHVYLPPGKISFERFDQEHHVCENSLQNKRLKIEHEKSKIPYFQARLADPLEMDKYRFESLLTQSKNHISQLNHELGGADVSAYDFYHKEPMDAAQFYADIAPLINELKELLRSEALAKRNAERSVFQE